MLMVTQETIIYRLVVRNNDFDAFFERSLSFWRENGRGRHGGAKGPGASRPDQKFGPVARPFGSIVISKTCFQNFRD